MKLKLEKKDSMALWEKAFDRVLTPLDEFTHHWKKDGLMAKTGIIFVSRNNSLLS